MNQNKSGIISEKREAAERLYNMLSQVREEYVMSAIGITGEVVAVEPETGYSKDSTADSGVYKEHRKESGHGWPRWSGMLIVAASFLIIAGIFWWILSGRSGNVNSVFSEEYYHKTVSSEYDNIVYIERIKPISEVPKNQLYTAEDIDMIMKELLGATGEIREVHEDIVDEQLSSYDEYRNGAPTGKAASVTFESGYIQYIVLRDGKVTGADDPAHGAPP